MLLSRSQLEELLQNTELSPNGKNLYAKCPKCGHREFGISLSKNHRFGCFRRKKCGWSGSIFTLIKFLGREDILRDKKKSVSIFEPITLFQEEDVEEKDLPEIKPPVGWKREYDNPYLRSRGWVEETFHKYKIGTSIFKKNYVTILIEMNQVCVGYVTRSYQSKEWHVLNGGRRFINSESDFSKILFGYDDLVDGVTDVILVEGYLDKTQVDIELNLDNNSWLKCCSTFGGKISLEQSLLLKNKGVKNLHILFEADIVDVIKKLGELCSVYFQNIRIGYLGEKDPNEMSATELISVLEQSKNFIDFNVSYL